MSDRAYPLHWPDGWPRSKNQTGSQFKTSLPGAMKNVNEELSRFAKDTGKKIESLVISSNFSLANQRPSDSGVACYFTWDGIATCIAVDRYLKIEDNLQAIFHCIAAERTKMRHGGLNLVRAAFRGYAALPPPQKKGMPPNLTWRDVLGVDKGAGVEEVKKAYQKMRSLHHPDRGGDPEKFQLVKIAWDQYRGASR